MRAINHALTGALIGLAVGEPLIAVPLAVISHFVCDVIPHYDGVDNKDEQQKKKYLRSNMFRNQLIADAALCLALVIVLAVAAPRHWLLAAICAFAAAAPDFLWARRYIVELRRKTWKPTRFDVFAGRIQWFQRPIGAVVEIAWFIGCIVLLTPFLTR